MFNNCYISRVDIGIYFLALWHSTCRGARTTGRLTLLKLFFGCCKRTCAARYLLGNLPLSSGKAPFKTCVFNGVRYLRSLVQPLASPYTCRIGVLQSSFWLRGHLGLTQLCFFDRRQRLAAVFPFTASPVHLSSTRLSGRCVSVFPHLRRFSVGFAKYPTNYRTVYFAFYRLNFWSSDRYIDTIVAMYRNSSVLIFIFFFVLFLW